MKRLSYYVYMIVCALCLVLGIFLATKDSHAQVPAQKLENPWTQPQEYDWYILMFFHEKGKMDEDGDPLRQTYGTWYTKPGQCEKKMEEMKQAVPENIQLDAILCFPLKKEPNQTRETV